MYKLTSLILWWLLPVIVFAQELKDPLFQSRIQGLHVGDAVPDMVLPAISTGGQPFAGKTGAYKDQLLLLDFWTTSCISCIAGMPKLDSLQRMFSGKVSVLLSTFEHADAVQKFRGRNPVMKKLRLASVVDDQLLGAYFPHYSMPHLVWIYQGVVKAITGSEYVTAQNIRMVLTGASPDWPVKRELTSYNYDAPLLHVRENTGFSGNPARYAALLGYQDGILPRTGIYRDTVNRVCRGYLINLPIVNAYFFLRMKLENIFALQRPSVFLTANQLVAEGVDINQYWYNPDSSGYLAAWQRLHLVCLEVSVPDTGQHLSDRDIYERMYVELHHLLGVWGGFEKRETKVLVLKRKNGTLPPASKSSQEISNLVFGLNSRRHNPPVFDESGYDGEMAIHPDDWENIPAINRQLDAYGLLLQEEIRPVDLFVIRKMP